MKLCGKVQTIEEIEKVIRQKGKVFLHDGGNHVVVDRRKIQGGEFKSRLFYRHYWVRVNSLIIDVKLTFDYREMRGEFACVDDKIWLLASRVVGLDKLLGNLTPFSTHFYGNVAGMNKESMPVKEVRNV